MSGINWYRNPRGRALIYIALLLLVIPLLLAYRIAGINPNAKLREYNPNERLFSSTAQVVSFQTADNLSIKGLYAASRRSNRLVIIIHGFGLTHKEMIRRGLAFYPDVADVCFIDLRNHGLSEGSSTSFGYHEALDVQAVARHFRSRYDEIIAWGSSMGAAAAVRAVIKGSSIDRLILEGLYDDLSNAIAIQARRYYIPQFPFVLISLLFYPYLLYT